MARASSRLSMLGVNTAQGSCIHVAHLILEHAVEQVDAATLALPDHAARKLGVPRQLIRGRLQTRRPPAQPPAVQQRVLRADAVRPQGAGAVPELPRRVEPSASRAT
jgi:hypothetical protein